MTAIVSIGNWLDRHPFLVRDFRRLRRKGRLWRIVLIPPMLTAILVALVHFGASRMGGSTLNPVIDYALLAMVFLIQTAGVLMAGDPLGGWPQEEEGQRVEALRLTPLRADELAIAATERRFYVRLLMAVAFLPVIFWAASTARLSALTLTGVYALLALTAWSLAPAGMQELVAAGASKIGGSNRQKQMLQFRGWSGAFLVIFYLPFLTGIFFATLSRDHHRMDFLIPTLGKDVTPHLLLFPMSLPLMAARYVMHARPFLHLHIVPLIWIAAIALLSREIRVLTAARLVRSDRVPSPGLYGQTMNVMAPPVDRQREDRPQRRLKIVRGLLLRVALVGAAWPLIETVGRSTDRLVALFIGLGALVGVVRSMMGSRSLFLPGRLEGLIETELPEAVRLGRVDSRGPLAIAVVAGAIGWEILALTLVLLLGGVYPHVDSAEIANLAALVGTALMLSEAGAISATLRAVPAGARKYSGTAFWSTGAAMTVSRLTGWYMIGLLISFLAVLGLVYTATMAPQYVPALALSPIVAWLLLLVEPARAGLTGIVLAPGLLAGAGAGISLSADRRSRRASSPAKAGPKEVVKKATKPLPSWIYRPLAFVVDRRPDPFVSLELNRLARKGTEVRAQLLAVGSLFVYLGFAIGVPTSSTVNRAFGDTGPGLFRPSLFFLLGMVMLFLSPMFTLGAAAGVFSRDWKAQRSNGGLSFLLMSPLSCRELLVGMMAGKLLRSAAMGIAGAVVGALSLAVALVIGVTPWMLLLAPLAILAGVLVGGYVVAAAMAQTGPERWRPWVLGVLSGLPVLLGIAASVGLAGVCDGSVWMTVTVISIVIVAIFVSSGYGWFRLGVYGIRRFRETDAASVNV
ncbi:MAG TPA: hypothetical protein VFJ58_14890 [Armatimonadota bacterium]|nr:hypothetical protein [Armatimonadota bacterium]